MARKGKHTRQGNEEVVITLGTGLTGMGNADYGYLAKTVQEELREVGIQVDENLQAIFDEIGKAAAKRLREISPENKKGKHAGRYKKGWVYESGKRTYNYRSQGVVRNKTDPQLTHLLEYGHPIVRNGKVVGQSPEIDHIRQTADWVANEIDSRLDQIL